MRPKQHETTGSGDLFRARLEQIINMKHELVQLAGCSSPIPRRFTMQTVANRRTAMSTLPLWTGECTPKLW